jgi:hypothetical protein
MTLDEQVPPEAAEAYRFAMIAMGQAQGTINPEAARAFKRIADDYLKKAEALGWRKPADPKD